MKATVIKFYDEQGNEIKNVSTEIVLNSETYVKKEADRQPDYSHLIGKYARWKNTDCCKILRVNKSLFFVEHNGEEFYKGYSFNAIGDSIEILDYNPDAVVGLKELPNDGNTYAECLEDVVWDGEIKMIKGFFYETRDGRIFNHENDAAPSVGFIITNSMYDHSSYFRIHTPAKPIWESCRETMWGYDNSLGIWTKDPNNDDQDESLSKLTKHLNALSYLSEIARRCNGDRVVDWGNDNQKKYIIYRYFNTLEKDFCWNIYREIYFLDEEARDYSFKVDKHIWLDYYGLPND